MAEGAIEGERGIELDFVRSSCHPAFFIDNFCSITRDGEIEPFKLWKSQIRLINTLFENDRVIILKARQLGISWCACGYALWQCLFRDNQLILLYSQGQDEANELLNRIKFLYQNLPDSLKQFLPIIDSENTENLVFKNRSRIKSLPATKRSGRGFTANLVILDEAAFLSFPEELYSALKPTVEKGKLLILSTANGLGNWFCQMWQNSLRNGAFKTIFLNWRVRPGRDEEWYERERVETNNPLKFLQEYPNTAEEAFVSSGSGRFHPDWIANQRKFVQKGKSAQFTRQGCTVFSEPVKAKDYWVGADVSEGVKGDYSYCVVVDSNGQQVCEYHSNMIEPADYAQVLLDIAKYYNDANLAVERNNHGHLVLHVLKNSGYSNLFTDKDSKRGWLTNTASKPLMIDCLADALKEASVQIRSETIISELVTYATLENGSTGAMSGYHDDGVTALAIALATQRLRRKRATNWA